MFDEVGDGCGAGETDREMYVVRDAADAVAFAARVAGDRGEVGVEFSGDVGFEEGMPVFAGEDDVDQNEG